MVHVELQAVSNAPSEIAGAIVLLSLNPAAVLAYGHGG
jgi:hypothetical protein